MQNVNYTHSPWRIPRRDGYKFKGWCESPDGFGKRYQASDYIEVSNDRLIYYYAIWEKAAEADMIQLYIQHEKNPITFIAYDGKVDMMTVNDTIRKTYGIKYENIYLSIFDENNHLVIDENYDYIDLNLFTSDSHNVYAYIIYQINYKAGIHGTLKNADLIQGERLDETLSNVPDAIPDPGYRLKGWILKPVLSEMMPQLFRISNQYESIREDQNIAIELTANEIKNTVINYELFDISDLIYAPIFHYAFIGVQAIAEFVPIPQANVTVGYYYDGIINHDYTEVMQSQTVGDKIDTYKDKAGKNYTFEKDENVPLTVNEDESLNIIRVYYVSKKADVTVEYYYDDKLDREAMEVYKDNKVGSIYEGYVDKPKANYVFDKVEPKSLTVQEDAGKNVIRVYYISKQETPTAPVTPKKPKKTENSKGLKTYDVSDLSLWLTLSMVCIVMIFIILLRNLYIKRNGD